MRRTIPTINRRMYQPPLEQRGSGAQKSLRRHLMNRDYYTDRQARTYRKVRLIIAFIFIVLITQGVFQIPLLQIRNVDIQGLKYISVDTVRPFIIEELQRRRFIFFKNSNYFLFAKQRLGRRLEERYFLRVIAIEKHFPNSLRLNVRERISGFAVQTKGGYTLLDTQGSVVANVTALPGNQAIIIDERSNASSTIPLQYLETATTIKELWDANLPLLALSSFHLTDDASRVIVTTSKNFQVFFSPTKDTAAQISRLVQYLQDTGVETPHQYIDLRFDEKLFIQ